MGQTAEVVAQLFGISREACDAYAVRSHQRAAADALQRPRQHLDVVVEAAAGDERRAVVERARLGAARHGDHPDRLAVAIGRRRVAAGVHHGAQQVARHLGRTVGGRPDGVEHRPRIVQITKVGQGPNRDSCALFGRSERIGSHRTTVARQERP